MKSFYTIIIILLLVFACKSETSKTPKAVETITVAEKIANAHGFEQWKNVSEINFTFNVDKDSTHFERSWTWQPKTHKVIQYSDRDTIVIINRKQVDSTLARTDSAFINDKFWLLMPFQLVWDKNAAISEVKNEEAPISKTKMSMITITYPLDGGYTPGDAYDIYFDMDYIIREWTFRKGNTKTPSLSTTFENYKDFNGIKIATNHKKENGNWNLNFTRINIAKD